MPVPKQMEQTRFVCTDARYANKAIKRERHVTPTVDDIVVKLNGAKIISKIDLKKGYNQIGIATQCRYITIICGIQGTLNISDDIIISGSTLEEHDDRLDRTLNNLQKAGITVNEKKVRVCSD